MKRGKAAGLDELTVEHVVHSHPVLIAILAKLFNIIMFAGYVPYGFRLSYTVPIPKVDTRAFQFGQKSFYSIRFDSRYRIDFFSIRFDSAI